MLTEICDYVHNYFEYTTYHGDFEVVDGNIDLGSLVLPGQRFKIVGSAMNDGIYTYREDGIYNDDNTEAISLLDERFTGTVIGMSVPANLIKLATEISDWVSANSAALNSPYTSESFGGYSYTKATGSGANAGGILGWQDVFRTRLNAYRKIA